MKRLNIYAGLPRSIYVMFIVQIVNAMGNFVYPFLTFFLTERVGLSAEAAGAYFMISAMARAFGSITAGKLTDHLGRKKLLVAFLVLTSTCFLPCPFLGNSILIPFFMALSSLFAGAAQPVSSAIVTDLTSRDNRKQAFSLLYMGVNIGFAIGPMIAGFLYKNHTNWIFFGNIFALLISATLILLFIEETMPCSKTIEQLTAVKDDESAEEGSAFKALCKRPILLMFSGSKLIYQFVYSCIGFAIPLQLNYIFGSSIGPSYYGIIVSFTAFVVIFLTMPLTHATIRLKPLITMALAGLFYAAGFGMIGIIRSLPLYLLSSFIFTIGEILEAITSGVYIANHSPITHRGRFNALITTITGTGFAVGPYMFGKFISSFGIQYLWLLCFSLTAIAGLFLFWLGYYEKTYERRTTGKYIDSM